MALTYEPLNEHHAQALWPALADPAVYAYIDIAPPENVKELAERLRHMAAGPPEHRRANEQWWNYAVRLEGTGEHLGYLEATLIGEHAEVSYVLGSAHWGHGHGTTCLEWLHKQLRDRTQCTSYWACIHPDNTRSIRLAERFGYQQCDHWPELSCYGEGDAVYRRFA